MIYAILVTLCLLPSYSYAIADDFCVGDVTQPMGPSGYACKDPATVTVDDFIYTSFRVGKEPSGVYNSSVELALANVYPALNGLGISVARLDLGVGGVIPMHTHRTSEVIIVAKGKIIAGFIDTNTTAYYKTLEVGDVMVFPQGMLHFQVNVGKTRVVAFVSLNSPNPAFQLVPNSLFAGNLPSFLIEKTMVLDPDQVTKLKGVFGGTN